MGFNRAFKGLMKLEIFSTEFFEKNIYIRMLYFMKICPVWESSSSVRTGRHDEAKFLFSQIFEKAHREDTFFFFYLEAACTATVAVYTECPTRYRTRHFFNPLAPDFF